MKITNRTHACQSCRWSGPESACDEIPVEAAPAGSAPGLAWRGPLKSVCPKCGGEVEMIEYDEDRDYDETVQEGRKVRKFRNEN